MHDHLPTRFTSSVSSFDANFFSLIAIVVEIVHTVGKVKSLNNVFPQQRQFIYNPCFSIMCSLKSGNIRGTLANYWNVLVS